MFNQIGIWGIWRSGHFTCQWFGCCGWGRQVDMFCVNMQDLWLLIFHDQAQRTDRHFAGSQFNNRKWGFEYHRRQVIRQVVLTTKPVLTCAALWVHFHCLKCLKLYYYSFPLADVCRIKIPFDCKTKTRLQFYYTGVFYCEKQFYS